MDRWCAKQIVVGVEGPDQQREVVVPGPFARVGAHPRSEIVLTAEGIARRCLYLHATDEGIYCLSLDLEDARLDERGRWLAPDDVLTVGPYRLTVKGVEAGPTELRPELVAWGSSLPPVPLLAIYCGRILKDKRRFRAKLSLLGRRPQCSLQLRGEKVSSFHCVLYWHDRRLWCVDLLSSNGTKLDGEAIDAAEMQLAQRLEVGEFSLLYHRWSPRESMQPGWMPAKSRMAGAETATREAEEEQASIAATHESGLIGDDGSTIDGSKILAELQQNLEQERSLLSAERESLAAARAAWEAERTALQKQLDEQAAQLAKVSAESPAAPSTPANPADLLATEPSAKDAETGETGPLAATDVDSGAGEPTPRILGRRAKSKATGDRITEFVAGRLQDIETDRRRRAVLIWTAVGVTAAMIGTIAFGVWQLSH